jgi:hypothetical protein
MTLHRRLHLAFAVCAFLALGLPAAATAQLAAACDASLWDHVYHPARLVKLHECMRVTGTIVLKRPEKNGDVHIQLKLDKIFLPLLDGENKSRQGGNLVLEPICVGNVTQADAIQPSQGLANQVSIPKKGDHVAVTGTLSTTSRAGTDGWRFTR